MPEQNQTVKPRRWRRWLMVATSIILVAGIGIWFYAQQVVKEKIEMQLADLGLGKPDIGSVAIGANGVSASDIAFFNSPADDQPAIKIDSLKITHPITGLAAGDETFNQIELAGLRGTVDINRGQTAAEFDLSDLSLPAKTLRLSDSQIVVHQTGRDDFAVQNIDLTATSNGGVIVVAGTLGQMAGGQWTVEASVNSQTNKWTGNFETASASIEDGVWQKWPLMPEALKRHIAADAHLSANITVNGSNNVTSAIEYQAEVNVSESRLRLPAFELPIEVDAAKLTVADGSVRYENVVASTDGQDLLKGSGTMTITEFPITTAFNFDFADLDVATLRKLVPAIPTEAQGRASGKFNGTADIESTLRTTLVLKGSGRSDSGTYGQICTDDLNATVEIAPLILGDDFTVETLEGSVVIKAQAKELPVDDILVSLDLEEIGDQLQIQAAGTGDFRLELPLATAEKLETWKMSANAIAAEGSISGQPVYDVRVKAHLESGNLKFTKVSAAADAQLSSQLNLTIDWPLANDASAADSGEFTVNGHQVAPRWLIHFIEQQIANAGGTAEQDSATAILDSFDKFNGDVNFVSRLVIPIKTPDVIKSWSVAGEVSDSNVAIDGYELRGLQSSFELNDGVLAIVDLAGAFDGGNLSGDGRLDVVTGNIKAADVVGDAIPLKWLAGLSAEINPDLKVALMNAGLIGVGQDEPLEGLLKLKIKLKPDDAGLLSAEPPAHIGANDASKGWAVSSTITAKKLLIKGKRLSGLRIEGDFDSQQIDIPKATFELPNRGKFDLSGNWRIGEQTGQADLVWQRLPIGWLASFQSPKLKSLAGTTSGKVQLSKRETAITEGSLPIAVTGSMSTDGVAWGGFKTRALEIDIRTENGSLLLGNFRADDNFTGLNLDGNLKLTKPYNFKIDGDISSLPISRIFALPSVTERIGETKEVTGTATAELDFSGDLETFAWGTSGKITVAAARIDGLEMSDFDAHWNHIGNDWTTSKAVINAFGGKIELKELVAKPSRIKVELVDLDATELSELTKLPLQFGGKISGDVSLNQWSVAERRWADLNLRGASAVVGPAEFADLNAKAKLKQQKLSYWLNGRLLNGKLTSKGETDLSEIGASKGVNLQGLTLPLEVQLTNASLTDLYKQFPSLSELRPLQGVLDAKAGLVFKTNAAPSGNGIVQVKDLTWNNERLTREISTIINLGNGKLVFDDVRADLKRGEISGNATIPLTGKANGTYRLDVRQFDLQRFLEIVLSDPIKGAGLLDARLSGQIGQSINGRGSLAINRAKLLGLSGRTFRVPVRFDFQPIRQSGRVEFRESKFQLFGGNVSGHAEMDFGRVMNVNADLRISKLDTEALFSSLADFDNSGQGDLSGRLLLRGKSIRSPRDLKGSFAGELDRAEAFKLPLIDTLVTFLGGNQIRSPDFNSDNIDLRLNAGRVEVKRLNLTNSLTQIAITGKAFVDGRLDLDVSARVEQLNQPTLIAQLAGSPLSRFAGSPVALFSQTANFLSDRLVFAKIGGTIGRPQVRPNAGKQLQEETIRYFLRGTQILPIADRQNN